jgi:integrase
MVKKIKVNGRWVWQARVAYKGLRKSTIREAKDQARTAEAELLQGLKAKVGQAAQQAEAPATLRSLFEAYAENLEARGKGADTIGRAVETARAFERLMPDLIDRPVDKIKEADIFAYRKARSETSLSAVTLGERAEALRRDGKIAKADVFARKAIDRQGKGTKPSTINRDLRTLRAMLKRALPDFRFPAGAFFMDDETRVRWLRPEEELLVLESMRSPFREIAKLAALTLMRLSEIRLLRREDVHLEQGVVLLPKAKAGARPVILGADAQKVLRHQLGANQNSDWVFPGPEGRPYDRSYIGRVFRRAARQAGLRDFHFHDLRHHGATIALNRGFTAPIVMALGGWKTERMMRRYAAVTDETLRRAAEAVAGNEQWQQSAKLPSVKA